MTTKIKNVVASQLPEFVREDYPIFTEFLEAYYDYLDQYETRNLTDIRDVDVTVDKFIEYFKSELNIFGESAYDHVDQQLLLRKVKQIYSTKGSEPAYKFIFKILFGKNIDISYPWNQVLKASDGKWRQENSIFINVLSGNVQDLPGNKIIFSGQNKKIRVYVERVEFVRDNVYEVFIDRNYYGTIELSDTVTFGPFSGEILPTTVGYKIESAGSGFKIGDIIKASTVSGSTAIETLLKITKVDSNGGIQKLMTIKHGAGYSDEFFMMLNKSTFSNSSTLAISKNSSQLFSVPDTSYLEEYNEFGFITNPNYWMTDTNSTVTFSDPTYVGTLLREYYAKSLNSQTTNDYALVRFYIGPIAKYQGHYISNDGFLDDIIKIQDSYYYQKYSYLITVDERLEDYATILKSYLHPAGMKLFGEYQIQNNYKLDVGAVLTVEDYQSKATYRTINKSITNEFMSMGDLGGRIRRNPYDLEDYFQVTYNPETYQDWPV